MSYISKGIVCLVASVAASFVASAPASAVPIDYRMSYVKGTFRFNPSGPGSGAYQHEFDASSGVFDDTFSVNDYRSFGPAGQRNASSTFIDNGVTMDWFEVVGNYDSQSFSFVVKNFIDENDDYVPDAPDALGLRSYANASFLLDIGVVFYDVQDPGDPDDDIPYEEEIVGFGLPILDGSGSPLTLNPGGWFMATYTISSVDTLMGQAPDEPTQRVLRSSVLPGDGFLITAQVPEFFFDPASVDPDPDPTAVPEPGTLALLGLGLLGLGAARRRRSGAQAGGVA